MVVDHNQSPDTPPLVEELVAVPATRQRPALRGLLLYPEEGTARARALVCCPHPYLGGTWENPVVEILARGLALRGIAALVWEYARPDQPRDARFEDGEAAARLEFLRTASVEAARPVDLIDARRALAWLVSAELGAEADRLAVAGYSYGGALALMLGEAGPPVLAVSPPLSALPAAWRLPHPRCTLLRAADDLALTSAEAAALDGGAVRGDHRSARSPDAHPWERDVVLPDCDHFYLGGRDALDAEIARWAGAFLAR